MPFPNIAISGNFIHRRSWREASGASVSLSHHAEGRPTSGGACVAAHRCRDVGRCGVLWAATDTVRIDRDGKFLKCVWRM